MRVSVCVPARNAAPYVGDAVRSALAQDVDGLEVLVHDDASSDGTADAVLEIVDPRVRYRRHHRALGVAENRNTLLASVRGEYVAWLDADDAYLPGGLARQLAVLDAEPAAALVHGGHHVVDEHGTRLPDWPAPFAGDAVEPGPVAFRHLLAANEIGTSTVVMRRAPGPFVRVGESSSDWDMWLRTALRGAVAYTAAPVAHYRQHAATISRGAIASGERLRCDIRVARRILATQEIPDRPEVTATADAALAGKALLHAGDLFTRGHRARSAKAIVLAGRLARSSGSAPLRAEPLRADFARLLAATLRGDAADTQHSTAALLAALAQRLDGTRYGARLAALATDDPEWTAMLHRAARRVEEVVPRHAHVAVVAKWDPTILRLSGRRGRNFPDRRLLPGGYPATSDEAIAHLAAVRRDGVTHLAIPAGSGWWLDHYDGFARHLAERHAPLWRGDDCHVYALRPCAG